MTEKIHATCISLEGKGVLLKGEPGSGKSDLALRLIDQGAKLVADDMVELTLDSGWLVARAPVPLKGKLEARGVGIMTLPHIDSAPVSLVVDLVGRDEVERVPERRFFDCLGIHVPLLSLHAFDESTIAKIRLYLQLL
jgi:HPr kinase/phosphorylase